MLDREPTPLFPNLAAPASSGPALRLLPGVRDHAAPAERVSMPAPAAGRAAPQVVPLLAADDPLAPELDGWLTALAHAARAGDRDARDAIYRALGPKIERMVARCRGLAWSAAGPRRDGRPWEMDDLEQEAYLAVVDLLGAWPGEGSVGPYLLAHLPWRLRTAWKRLATPRRREAPFLPSHADLFADGSAVAEHALVLLEELAATLPPPDGAILLLRIRDGRSIAAIGRRLRLGRRTVDRRWHGLRLRLRSHLEASVGHGEGMSGATRGDRGGRDGFGTRQERHEGPGGMWGADDTRRE